MIFFLFLQLVKHWILSFIGMSSVLGYHWWLKRILGKSGIRISYDEKGTSSCCYNGHANDNPAPIPGPKRLLLDLTRLYCQPITFFLIYSAIVSNFCVFFTSISTFSSRCNTFSIFSFIIPWRLSSCLINYYFLSWSLLLLKKVSVGHQLRTAACRFPRRRRSYPSLPQMRFLQV